MVRRYARKRDANEAGIVKMLHAIGASVQALDGSVGLPDLLVGYQGRNYLIEVKDPAGFKRGGRQYEASRHGGLDPKQREWHLSWRGQVAVAKTPEEAVSIVVGHIPPGEEVAVDVAWAMKHGRPNAYGESESV